jgi:hypothetical protein
MPHHKTLLKAFRFLENLAALFFLLLRHKFSSIACVKLVNFNAGKRKSRKFGSLGVMHIYTTWQEVYAAHSKTYPNLYAANFPKDFSLFTTAYILHTHLFVTAFRTLILCFLSCNFIL